MLARYLRCPPRGPTSYELWRPFHSASISWLGRGPSLRMLVHHGRVAAESRFDQREFFGHGRSGFSPHVATGAGSSLAAARTRYTIRFHYLVDRDGRCIELNAVLAA